MKTLFLVHTYISYIFGGIAFLFPWMFGVFSQDGAVNNGVHHSDHSQAAVAHLMIRLFGAMWLGQGYVAMLPKASMMEELKKLLLKDIS